MKTITRSFSLSYVPVLLLASALFSGPANAADVYLRAAQLAPVKQFPDGSGVDGKGTMPVAMWGYAECNSTFTSCGTISSPGPNIRVLAGNDLTIHVQNQLPPGEDNITKATSVIIPGLPKGLAPVRWTGTGDASRDGRIYSFDAITANTATGAYTWSNVSPGTYLYHSGTHPQVQVQMGLYGAVIVEAQPNFAYPDMPIDRDAVLVISEVDPALHAAVAADTYGTSAGPTSTENYQPRFFLINGTAFTYDPLLPSLPIAEGALNERTLLRLVNAGIENHAMQLLGGYFEVVAEDGHRAPTRRSQNTILLPAGKTQDVLLQPKNTGTYTLFDRRLRTVNDNGANGGIFARIVINGPTTGDQFPFAVADSAIATEGGNAVLGDVLWNDDPGDTPASVISASQGGGGFPLNSGFATAASATLTLNTNGTYSYLPPAADTLTSDIVEVFNYTMADSDGDQSSSTLGVSVRNAGPGEPPTVPLTVVTPAAYVATGNSSSHAVSWPTLTAGQRLVAAVVSDGGPTINLPAGFARRGNAVGSFFGSQIKAEVFELNFDVNGQPSGPVTLSGGGSSQMIQVAMFVIAGHNAAQPIEVATNSGSADLTITYPSINPAGWGNENTLWLQVGGFDGGNSHSFSSEPAGYTNSSAVSSSSQGVGRTSGWRVATAASEQPSPATWTGGPFGGLDQWVALSIAVRVEAP